jgi:AraC-like DNA-binding protein
MSEIKPYWNTAQELSQFQFSIKKVDRNGYFDVSDIPQATLPFHAFAFLTEGEILMEIEGSTLLCKAGQILLIPARTPFHILYFNGNAGYECGFSMRFLKDPSYPCLHSPHPLLLGLSEKDMHFNMLLMEELFQANQHKKLQLAASALDLFLCRLETPEGHPGNPLVNRFLEMVFDRKRKPGKVTVYADALCITPNYLNRLVRQHTEHSAMDWIEISRLKLAKMLLRQNQLQVAEIASAVGIDDQSYFTRFFKKMEGCTPTQYRLGEQDLDAE